MPVTQWHASLTRLKNHLSVVPAWRRQQLMAALAAAASVLGLFGCGQLALINIAPLPAPLIRSVLKADYGPWTVAVIQPLAPEIIDVARRERKMDPDAPLIVPGAFWLAQPVAPLLGSGPALTPIPNSGELPTLVPTLAPLLTARATASPIPQPTATATATGTNTPTATRTATRTASATAIGPTATTTRTITPTRTPTVTGTLPTATRTPTHTSTHTATHTATTPATASFTPSPTPPPATATLVPTATSTPQPTPSATPAPTATFTATSTPTMTNPPPPSSTPTNTVTATFTPSFTPTSTDTPTPTDTPSNTPTPTDTPPPCGGGGPPGEPEIIPPAAGPDGAFATIACGTFLILDLGAAPIVAPHAGYDLIYYEREIAWPGGWIFLDWVAIDVCADAACTIAYTVFVWGDANPDLNTNIGQAGYLPPELDNQAIPLTDLAGTPPYQTGIAIDVDAIAPPGIYGWVRIWSPFGGDNDPAEIDALEVLP